MAVWAPAQGNALVGVHHLENFATCAPVRQTAGPRVSKEYGVVAATARNPRCTKIGRESGEVSTRTNLVTALPSEPGPVSDRGAIEALASPLRQRRAAPHAGKSVPVEYRSHPAQRTGHSADSSTTSTSRRSGFARISHASDPSPRSGPQIAFISSSTRARSASLVIARTRTLGGRSTSWISPATSPSNRVSGRSATKPAAVSWSGRFLGWS